MMYENVNTGVINDEDLPWTPFTPYSDVVSVKLIKADPVRGETVTFLKAPVSISLPRHRHTGTVIVYTIKGAWKYIEHDWVARPGSVVYETAGTSHTPIGIPGHGDEIITLNITVGDLLYFDNEERIVAIESWQSAVERYLAFCKANGIEAKDVTAFNG